MMHYRVVNRHTLFTAGLILAAMFAFPVAAYERTDVVTLKNGDRITGEVKSLTQGQLSFKTDTMGTISVKWDEIASVVTKKPVQVVTTDQRYYFGHLEQPAKELTVAVRTDSRLENLPTDEVVRINPTYQSFWQQLNGSLSVGLSYTKSSDVGQLNINGEVAKRTREYVSNLTFSVIRTEQTNDTTDQVNVSFLRSRRRGDRWFTNILAAYQSNETVGIDHRVLFGGGGGRVLKETNNSVFALLGGLDVNQEYTTGADGTQTSLEAYGAVNWSLFTFHGNTHNLSLQAYVFPSLTESGRVRSQLSTTWRQDLGNNLTWNLNLYGTTDTDPPQGAEASSDYGITSSLGWSFSP